MEIKKMSHEGNDRIKEQVSEEVDNMPALELLNKCDELGIKTSEIPMEELMDKLQDALLEIRMQPYHVSVLAQTTIQ